MTTILFCIFTTKVQHCFIRFSLFLSQAVFLRPKETAYREYEMINWEDNERKRFIHLVNICLTKHEAENSVEVTESCLGC
jgi:hypothetical protein